MDNIYFKNTTDVWFVNTVDVTWRRVSPARRIQCPAFRAYGILSADQVSRLIQPPAFRAYGILSADQVSRLIQPPAFRAYGILSTDWQIQLLPPPLSAITYLRAMNAAIFADRGYWITYACVLSGTPELFLPMSSFRAELRADGVSHLTVNVPGDEYYEAVALRVPVEISDAEKETLDGYPDLGNYDPYAPAGRWVWYYNHINYPYGRRVGGYKWVTDEIAPLITPPPPSPQKEAELGRLSVYMIKNYFTGEQQGTLLAEVDLSDVNYSRDAVSRGIVLSGSKTKSWTPKSSRVYGAQYKSIIGGKYRYRCVPGYNINPGDTVIMEDGNTFVAGMITWIVSPGQEIMELAEAELESYL